MLTARNKARILRGPCREVVGFAPRGEAAADASLSSGRDAAGSGPLFGARPPGRRSPSGVFRRQRGSGRAPATTDPEPVAVQANRERSNPRVVSGAVRQVAGPSGSAVASGPIWSQTKPTTLPSEAFGPSERPVAQPPWVQGETAHPTRTAWQARDVSIKKPMGASTGPRRQRRGCSTDSPMERGPVAEDDADIVATRWKALQRREGRPSGARGGPR